MCNSFWVHARDLEKHRVENMTGANTAVDVYSEATRQIRTYRFFSSSFFSFLICFFSHRPTAANNNKSTQKKNHRNTDNFGLLALRMPANVQCDLLLVFLFSFSAVLCLKTQIGLCLGRRIEHDLRTVCARPPAGMKTCGQRFFFLVFRLLPGPK